MTDHFQWRSLDELMPVRLVQPTHRPIGFKPSEKDLRGALESLRLRCGDLPRDFANRLYAHVGLAPVHQPIIEHPDTWAAVIKFCDEYQPDPSKGI